MPLFARPFVRALLPRLLALALLSALTIGAAERPAVPDVAFGRATDYATLRRGFREPPASARPWFHWFWWDSILSREGIARELKEMAAAGFGTAEIRIITDFGWPPKRRLPGREPSSLAAIGHRRYPYLSPEWIEMFAFACEEAERLGLRLSFNLGQGWPPGGPWVTDEHRSKLLVWETQEISEGQAVPLSGLEPQTRVLAWRLRPGADREVETDSFIELTSTDRASSSAWTAPDGRWLVVRFTVKPGGLVDKGDGPEVDPASPEAVRFHLVHLFDRLDPAVGRHYGKTLIDAAADSWEYVPPKRGETGRFWSEVLPQLYEQRTGRPLFPQLHALLGYGPAASEVVHALEQTEHAAVKAAFFRQATDFLQKRGLGSRAQIYGRGLHRDLLDAYLQVTTPEVEQGIYCVPEAIWAARTTGKPIVSSESFTHLSAKMGRVRRPHAEWETNPGHLRGASNELLAEGVNRIQFHSFSYSPPGLPYPGWRMYAETHFNRNAPWWPEIGALAGWLSRHHWLWQAGRPVADALVYPVRADPPDGPFREQGDRQPVRAANVIDGANAVTLPHVAVAAARGDYALRNLLVREPVANPAEARHLLTLVETGATLLDLSGSWEDWPALLGPAAADLRTAYAAHHARGSVKSLPGTAWDDALASRRSVRWDGPGDRLDFQHRQVTGADLYLLVNLGDDFVGEVSFPHPSAKAELWDTDTGRIVAAPRAVVDGDRQRLHLEIPHAESVALIFVHDTPTPRVVTAATGGVFGRTDDGLLIADFATSGHHRVELSDGSRHDIDAAPPAPLPLSGPWHLTANETQALTPTPPIALDLPKLVSWRTLEPLSRYAGRATYETTFELPVSWIAPTVAVALDLGDVYELARVEINGRDVGLAWAPPYRLDVTDALQPGANRLRITVANQMKNSLSVDDPFMRPANVWGQAQADAAGVSDYYLRPSGLLGPVVLRATHRWLAPAVPPLP